MIDEVYITTALYRSACLHCGRPIFPGAEIAIREGSERAAHRACSETVAERNAAARAAEEAQAERYEAEADARWTASHPTMDGRAGGG